MNKEELIYLASPYSIGNKEENFRIVSNKSAELVSEGYTVISPITYGHTLLDFKNMPDDWGFWMNFCSQLLYRCDRLMVYKMPGWDISKGLEQEMSIAKDHCIPIEYLEYEDDEVRENGNYREIKWDL